MRNGYDEYIWRKREEQINQNTELNFKLKMAELVSQNSDLLRTVPNHKITKVMIEEIKSNFIGGKRFGITELIAFCVYFKISVVIQYENNIRMYITAGDEAVYYTLYYDKTKKNFSINTFSSSSRPAPLPREIVIEQYNKPIRGFSAYKTADLYDMCDTLGISPEIRASKNKKELYEFIRETILISLPGCDIK